MDALDFELLAALARRPRATYAELGEGVHLSPNAVKARVLRMGEEGVLQGFSAIPRPSLLGLSEGLVLFTHVEDLHEREDEMLRGLAELPGVRFADSSFDQSVWVWLLYRDDADWERIERALVSLVGKPPARLVKAPSAAQPRPLAPGDWKVVRALLPDGRAPANELAARAGLTHKPLKRRLDALVGSGDVRIAPIVSPAEASGLVLFRVVCFLREGATLAPVPHALVSREAPGVVTVTAARPTLRDARSLERALAATPGVERAHLQLATRRASLCWLDDAMTRAMAAPVPRAVAPVPLPRAR